MTSAQSPVAQPKNDDPSPQRTGAAVPTFAERLNRLFDTVKPPGRGYFRSGELVDSLNANDVRISAPYVSQLRSGNRKRPSASTIEAIAGFFRVNPAYFTDPECYRLIDQDLTVISAMRDPGVRRVATRTIGLSAHAIDEIVEAVDELRSEERPPQPAPSPSI
jgi:transcriptional regulator with XRE-family HTH domain